jgi:hypothetical protein
MVFDVHSGGKVINADYFRGEPAGLNDTRSILHYNFFIFFRLPVGSCCAYLSGNKFKLFFLTIFSTLNIYHMKRQHTQEQSLLQVEELEQRISPDALEFPGVGEGLDRKAGPRGVLLNIASGQWEPGNSENAGPDNGNSNSNGNGRAGR